MKEQESKGMRLAVCVPSTGQCKMQFTWSLANMLLYTAYNGINGVRPQEIQFRTMIGSSGISSNREQMIRQLIEAEYTHILFIDEDMGFPPNALERLAAHDLDIVGVNYRMKAPGADFTAITESGERLQTTSETSGLAQVIYSGFGFCLMKLDVFKAFEDEPMFAVGYISDEHRYTTEDWYCFTRLREKGYVYMVDQDVSKDIIHVGDIAYKWSDVWDESMLSRQTSQS